MKETITKHFFSPIWKCDKIEAELEKLEKDGWRLNKISGFRKFQFVKSPPKETKYFFTFSLARDSGPGMIDTTYLLKQQHQATKIDGNFIEGLKTTSIYRITKDADLTQQKIYRNIFLRHLVMQNIWLPLFFVVLSVVCIALDNKSFWNMENICFFAVGFIGIAVIIYNLIVLIYLRKQYKMYFQMD